MLYSHHQNKQYETTDKQTNGESLGTRRSNTAAFILTNGLK